MRSSRFACLFPCLLAAALIGGCGSDSATGGPDTAKSRPAPPKSEFPSASGKTLRQVLEGASHSDLVVSPAAMAFYKGENRYPFGVFHADRSPVSDAKVALYFAKAPPEERSKGGKEPKQGKAAKAKASEEPAIGPFPAAIETLATEPAFRAATTVDDPNAATVVYTTDVDFPSNGEWQIAAVIKEGDKLKGTLLPSVMVGEFHRIPRPGQEAPLIHTPTPADVGGDLSKITTRIPPDTQNRVDYADAFGKEPIILLFATPQFCQSRVCGPVVDVAEQVKQLYGDKAAFIHMEIYEDNDPSKPARPQVKAFHLPTEPWLFAIGRDGTVDQTIEGAFGVEALTKAVKKVTAE
jgi:hypothetical protein